LSYGPALFFKVAIMIDFKIGQKIVFDIETWPDGKEMIMKEVSSEILDICIDPCGHHESKCMVKVDSVSYGVPFSYVKKVYPAAGEQLFLL